MNTNKYKKQLKQIEELGMVGPKSTRTRVVGIITDEMHPYTFFVKSRYLKIRCRDVPRLLLSPLLLFVYFWPYRPYLLLHFILVAFYTYTCNINVMPYTFLNYCGGRNSGPLFHPQALCTLQKSWKMIK